MTEAERRAAFEVAVVEALEAQSVLLHALTARAGISSSLMSGVRAKTANVRTLHEIVVDAAPVPLSHRGGERAL